ncbi:MAG: FAD-dependent oxidoreductase, partial [Actinobacteria bacterium]|nr:FAD-dependent oxidoreductase [Actinomycetota bacterium]
MRNPKLTGMRHSTITTTDVLVVGAGPAGLATAVSALRHGGRVLVAERRAGTSSIPRATGVSTRTMEIFRTWGLDDAIRAGAVDCDPRVAVATTLSEDGAITFPFS